MMTEQSAGIKRLVFKKIVDGDRRKFEAASNDSDTGGGARDLRFSPFSEFSKIFHKMFICNDNGNYSGDVNWYEGDILVTRENTFFKPTKTRGNEGRLTRIHESLPSRLLPNLQDGDAILVLVQREDDSVWAFFTTEQSLIKDDWHETVSSFILAGLSAKRAANTTAMGFKDFQLNERFYNGK